VQAQVCSGRDRRDAHAPAVNSIVTGCAPAEEAITRAAVPQKRARSPRRRSSHVSPASPTSESDRLRDARFPRRAGPVESPTRCPCDNEGRSASAVASRRECCSTPEAVISASWPPRVATGSHAAAQRLAALGPAGRRRRASGVVARVGAARLRRPGSGCPWASRMAARLMTSAIRRLL
jgi:hypothetical protein